MIRTCSIVGLELEEYKTCCSWLFSVMYRLLLPSTTNVVGGTKLKAEIDANVTAIAAFIIGCWCNIIVTLVRSFIAKESVATQDWEASLHAERPNSPTGPAHNFDTWFRRSAIKR